MLSKPMIGSENLYFLSYNCSKIPLNFSYFSPIFLQLSLFFQFQVKPTFQYIFDINFDNAEASESLQYLKDGFFIDNATKSLDVQLITYNGEKVHLQPFSGIFT